VNAPGAERCEHAALERYQVRLLGEQSPPDREGRQHREDDEHDRPCDENRRAEEVPGLQVTAVERLDRRRPIEVEGRRREVAEQFRGRRLDDEVGQDVRGQQRSEQG
jgi:hypothetical protein